MILRSILNRLSSPIFLLVLLLLLYTHICLFNLEGDVLHIMSKCFNSFFITYSRTGIDRSVSLLDYVMDVRGIIVRFPTRSRNLSLLQSVQKGSEIHQLSTVEISGVSYPREETSGCKIDHSPPLIAPIKNIQPLPLQVRLRATLLYALIGLG